MSIVTYEKPMMHLPLEEFKARVQEMAETSDNYRNGSFAVRHSARQLRNETRLRATWDTYFNDLRLKDRLVEVTRWREVLEKCLLSVQAEISKLKSEKAFTDICLEIVTHTPIAVVSECITLRDGRHGNNLSTDEAYVELQNELEVVEALKTMLSDRCQSSWDQLNRLNEAEFKLLLDLGNKTDAIEIDSYNLEMDKDCSGTTYKADALRIPKNCIPYEKWLEISQLNKLNMENEISTAIKLRENMQISRERAYNALRAQQDVTNFNLRKSVFETQRIKNELQWQRLKLSEEMERNHKELKDLQDALRDKTDATKLAETRLENRMFRGGPELVQDAAQDGMAQEVVQLGRTRQVLMDKISQTMILYNDLEAHLVRLDVDLENTSQALMTDLRCIDIRRSLLTAEQSLKNQSEPTFHLTTMVDEIPPSVYHT